MRPTGRSRHGQAVEAQVRRMRNSGSVSPARRSGGGRAWALLVGFTMTAAGLVAATGTPVGAAGGQALAFDGQAARVEVPDHPGLRPPVMTLEAWVKPTAAKHAFITGKNAWALGVAPAYHGVMFRWVLGVDGILRYADSPPLPLNRWYAVAGTYDGMTMRLFVNGQAVKTQTYPGTVVQDSNLFRIGSLGASNDFFEGLVDEVRLSNVVRYGPEGYVVRRTPFTPDAHTIGLWHLDEGTGTTTADASGNGHNGTLWHGPAWTTDSPFTPPETTPPVVTNRTVTKVTTTTAQVSWRTDEAATSIVEWGTTTAYGSWRQDTALVTRHGMSIGGLTPNTTYHYRIITRDAWLNETVTADGTFTTAADPSDDPQVLGSWGPLMSWPSVAVHLVPLHTGEFLVWDAWEIPSWPKVWDPVTDSWTLLSNPYGLFCSGVVQLPDGKILIAGGHAGAGVGIAVTFIFDPVTRTFTQVDDMAYARWYPGATKLGDGRAVLISGNIDEATLATTPEVFDPATNTWTSLTGISTDDMPTTILYPAAFTRPDGKVAVIAPSSGITRTLDVDAQTYESLPSTWQTGGTPAQYRPGKLLISGGGEVGRLDESSGQSMAGTQLIDLTQPNPTWRTTSSMEFGRAIHMLTVLADGTVMAIGGNHTNNLEAVEGPVVTELWDPATETWSRLAPMAHPRMYHSTSALLPDGRVLVAGGGRLGVAVNYLDAQIYSPPYLFKGPRPEITDAPAAAAYGDAVTVGTPQAADIASVNLINLATSTHNLDQEQRFVPLSFTKLAGQLTVQIPSNRNVAPPGYYMLNVVDSNGVPSVARIVHLSGPDGGDTTAPQVEVTEPADGATLTGTATLAAEASDDVGVVGVTFKVDGNPVGPPVTTAPFSATWNTTTVADGTYTVTAEARDAAGNVGTSEPVTVTVANGPPDTTPPVISDVSAEGVSGTSAVITWTTDEPADGQVEYGTTPAYGQMSPLSPSRVTEHSVAIAGLSPGTTYHFRVRSRDASGNLAVSEDFTFTTNESTALFCAITTPEVGAQLQGVVPIHVIAEGGDGGITSVQVRIDDQDLGPPLTAPPWTVQWDTRSVTNGEHTITAVARDASGQTRASDPVTVTVTNADPVFVADSTTTDFGTGSHAGTYVAKLEDGEVMVAPTLGEEFEGSAVPPPFTTTAWQTGGTAEVAGGALRVDGARVRASSGYPPGRWIEFSATFVKGAANQDVGFGSNNGGRPWAVFGTRGGGRLWARSAVSSTVATETDLGTTYLDGPHLFRIAWTATEVVFSVDGVVVATHTTAPGQHLRPLVSDRKVGGPRLTVHWLQMGPGVSSGTFTSRVFDAGAAGARWGPIDWNAHLPSGSAFSVAVRTGETPSPDGSWGPWTEVAKGQDFGSIGRYAQYRVTLARGTGGASPIWRDVMIRAVP